MPDTMIKISEEVWLMLNKLKQQGESFNEVLERIIKDRQLKGG